MRSKMAAGNWKMNGSTEALQEVARLAAALPAPQPCDIVLCPPTPYLAAAVAASAESALEMGAQDCHASAKGAHTGDIAAPMIADVGARHVIVGHSERRTDHNETDADVAAKTQAGWDADLNVILCLGESADVRAAGDTLSVIKAQLAGSVPRTATPDRLVLAYEPIWAIGTGAVATTAQIDEVHDFIRAWLVAEFGPTAGAGFRVLYGGSVKPDNAAAIFACANVDGALVGGASLKADDFSPIITSLQNSA